jgi:hypothetical protein
MLLAAYHRLSASLPKMTGALRADPVAWYRENGLDVPSWLEETATNDTGKGF